MDLINRLEKIILINEAKEGLSVLQHDSLVINRNNPEKARELWERINEVGLELFGITNEDKLTEARLILDRAYDNCVEHTKQCKTSPDSCVTALINLQHAAIILHQDDKATAQKIFTKISEIGYEIVGLREHITIDDARTAFNDAFDKGWEIIKGGKNV